MRKRPPSLLLLVLIVSPLACAGGREPLSDAGTYVTEDVTSVCTESAECDDRNPCTNDFCTSDGVCENIPNTNPCDDQDPCTGDTFCADRICVGFERCCTDTLDNDGDGQADCADPDCAMEPACLGECPVVDAPEPVSLTPLTGETGDTHETTGIDGFTDDYVTNAAGALKVGTRREWGGSIIFYGMVNGSPGLNGTNTIDANDTGREVQVAFYDPDRAMQNCAHDASCRTTPTECANSITYLGWNPVQGGNRCNNGSDVESVDFTDGRLTISTQPLHWNPAWDREDCASDACGDPALAFRRADVRVVQSVRFISYHIVELDYTLENLGDLDHATTAHELPTVYTANGQNGPDLWRLFASDGTEIAIDIPANDGFYYRNFDSPGGWVTLQDDGLTYGVGLYYENHLTAFQGWQNRALPFNNFRAIFPFGIPAHGTVRARSYLLIGARGTIETSAAWLDANLPPFGVLDAPAPDAAVAGATLPIHGWALDNRGVVSVEAVIDGGPPFQLGFGSDRADVCAVYPGYPDCPAVGYTGELDLSALSFCDHLLEIRAIDSDGNTRIIARRRFSRSPAR